MKTPTILLLVVVLSGCLGGDPAPASPDEPPEPEPSPGPAPETPGADEPGPMPPAPAPAQAGNFSFEGNDCVRDAALLEIPYDRVDPHYPVDEGGGQTTARVRAYLFACASATLEDGSFRPDVHLFFLDVLLPATESDLTPYYVLEAASDWPALLSRIAATGTPTYEATFTTDHADMARSTTLRADGFEYLLEAPLRPAQDLPASDDDETLYTGTDVLPTLRLLARNGVGDNFPIAGTVDFQGGLGGELTEGPWPAEYSAVKAQLRLFRTDSQGDDP